MSHTTASLKAFPPSALALACLHALAGPLPTGADIRQGSGTIATTGSGLEIRQTSQKLVTDWQTFNIGAGQRVEFIQPGRDSVALNRVIGGSPTEILGQLKANGRVYIENAAGVLFAPGAQVDVGSLVATSLHVDPESLDGGRLRLSGDASAGAVINQGHIQTSGGDVILAGPRVVNAGDIVAPGGQVALAAGSAVSIDPSGTGLLSVQVSSAALQARVDAGGRIEAAGITLAAAARDAIMRVDGTLRARTAENRGGTIVLSGGAGAVDVAGTLDASGGSNSNVTGGNGNGQSGGTVQVLGDRIALRDSARIDVSGTTGGGTVRIGGDARGLGSLQHASTTDIAQGAVIDASATQHGQGGSVAVWSDQTTRDAGTILARGGASGGDGGQVEISSAGHLDLAGVAKIDTTAAHGRRGQLLLDPESLEIVDDSQQDVNGDGTGDPLSGPTLPYGAPGNPSRVGAGQVARLLNSTDVTLQANDRLDVLAPITVAAGGPATTLTLNGTIINVEAPITLNNSALVAQTPLSSDAIRVDATITSLTSVALISTDIQLNADVSAPHVLLSSGDNSGNVNQFAGRVVADDLDIHMGWGVVHMGDGDNLASRVDIDADMATLQARAPGGTIAMSGTVHDDFAFTTAGSVAQTRPLTVGGAFTLNAGGSAQLTDAGNDFYTVAFTTGGAMSLNDANDLTASGVAGGNVLLTATGLFSTGGSLQTTGAGATLDIRSAGFDNSGNGGSNALLVQPDGRFFIRSSDYTRDQLGSLAFSANGNGDVNYTILGGWHGADPTGGNGYYTNRTGTIAAPAGDRPGLSRVYDGTTGFDFSQSGHSASADLDGGVNASLGDYSVRSHGAFDDKNAGSGKGYTVAASDDVTARAADGSVVYGLHYGGYTRVAGNVGPLSEITPRALVSTGITGVDRAYDGTTSVGLNLDGASLNQVVAGDDVHLGATGTMADKNVGSAKSVGVTASLSGADAANYTVTDASTATVTITPRALVSTGITGVDRVYDGTTSVGLNLGGASLNQVVAGDDVHLGGATGTLADKDVGTSKTVSVTARLSGADAANYTVTDASGATATVTPRVLTVTGLGTVDRETDGTRNVTLRTGGAGLGGVIGGDSVQLDSAGARGQSATSVAGEQTVSVSNLALDGRDAKDYVLQSPTLTVDLHAPFERLRYHEYQQAVVDAQEPFRRQQLEVFLSGFGKENIRKPLRSGQVFETGYAPPAIDDLEGARPVQCPPLPARCKRDETAEADARDGADAAARASTVGQGRRP